MSDARPDHDPTEPAPAREPAFNAPTIVLLWIVGLAAIHAATEWAGDPGNWGWWYSWAAFVPGFITLPANTIEIGMTPWWSFVSHGFLHGDWLHLAVNGLWLLAMGTPVARRFGAVRFSLFLILGFVAGASMHLAFYWGALVPMVGASGGVSALFGAAARFALSGGGLRSEEVHLRPRLSIVATLSDRGVASFILIWLAVNFLFGAGVIPVPGAEGGIAWQAHVGGFAFGLLGFALFDPQER